MLTLVLISQSYAAAYYFLDSGTRAISRGGAFIAGADDLSAQYYNPAALGNISRPMLNLNVWGVGQAVTFERKDSDETLSNGDQRACYPSCEAIHNEAAPMVEPQGGYALPLGRFAPVLDGSTFAFGMYVPTSPNMAFDPNGPQRYEMNNSLIWQIYAGPSLALHTPKVPWLTLGLGLQYTLLRVDESLAISSVFDLDGSAGSGDPNYTDAQSNDVVLDLRSWDYFKPSWNAGFMITPVPWIKIGAAVQPAITYTARGSLDVVFNDENPLNNFLEDKSASDKDVQLTVTVPWIVRAGVEVNPIKPLKIEGAFVWTKWDDSKDLKISDIHLLIHTKQNLMQLDDVEVTDDVHIPTGFVNAWSARLGGDYQIVDWARVSAGGYYESSAVTPERLGVSVVDSPKWGFGLGGTFSIKKRVDINVAFGEQFLANQEITNSEFRQITLQTNPMDPADSVVGEGLVVGNGHFSSTLTFIGVGGTVYFGKTE